MKRHGVTHQSSLSIAMSAVDIGPEFTGDANGLSRSGDIAITVATGELPMFLWPDAIAYGLMVDSSLTGDERTVWEVHSTVGFSTSVAFGRLPQFAEEICAPLPLVPGCRYFVSVYGTYPRYGIQEFVL